MQLSYEILNILIFLIPGFLSIVIYNSIVTRKEKDNFRLTIEALIYSLLSYVISSVIYKKSVFILGELKEDNTTKYFLNYELGGVLFVLSVSVLSPLFIGFLNNNNVLQKILYKLKISRKTSRETTWLDVFSDVDKYLIVNLKDGRRVYGWPSYYSSTAEEGMLYLREPSWINENNEYVDLDLDGLFLIEKNNIDYIEMLNHPQTPKKESIWKNKLGLMAVLKKFKKIPEANTNPDPQK